MDIDRLEIKAETIQLITGELASNYRTIPYSLDEGIYRFFIERNERTKERKEELELILGYQIKFEELPNEEIGTLLSRYYRQTKQEVTQSFSLAKSNKNDDFLSEIIYEAKAMNSSDIHIECLMDKGRIRYRIDGHLIERYLIPMSDLPTIINKIKIRAKLDIAEKRLPQDGRIKIKKGKEEYDLRVSSVPVLQGEKIVLRILNKDSLMIDLDSIIEDDSIKTMFHKVLQKSQGLILISGPTGSGKTTTLYSCLKHLNTTGANLLTVEDPIEYTLEGANQVQLREDIGLSFSVVLKTFLRQDPDIIMVGEIRDEDTAQIAIRAALTGHLVLSTVHTNSAWGIISRLIDMGIPPYLLASTLSLAVSQRLVRVLCQKCKAVDEDTSRYDDYVNTSNKATFYKPIGCEECYFTGYRGRRALFEIIPITQELISETNYFSTHKQANPNDVQSLKSTRFIKDAALKLLLQGTTSLEEVLPYLL